MDDRFLWCCRDYDDRSLNLSRPSNRPDDGYGACSVLFYLSCPSFLSVMCNMMSDKVIMSTHSPKIIQAAEDSQKLRR